MRDHRLLVASLASVAMAFDKEVYVDNTLAQDCNGYTHCARPTYDKSTCPSMCTSGAETTCERQPGRCLDRKTCEAVPGCRIPSMQVLELGMIYRPTSGYKDMECFESDRVDVLVKGHICCDGSFYD